MSYARRFGLFAAAALSFALGACSDGSSPLSPLPPEASQSNSGSGSSGSGSSGSNSGPGSGSYPLNVLRRTTPLLADEVKSARVGLLGATIVLPKAGLTVVVPPLAAPLGTTITVKAPKGDLVGYEFGPHGIRFRLPVVLTQDLTKTNSTGLLKPIVGGYFTGPLGPVVQCLELLKVNVLNLIAVMPVTHFSGYVIATE
jgi:hypothetical protein